ncbi:MAG: two-component sensor histidine kinase [Paenibacillaceae bacterium ZCTH02-B3]|nr:MAG: two-component sensor histidine kinase [Paenibacillaceae bacterium ZCTH02-B3]
MMLRRYPFNSLRSKLMALFVILTSAPLIAVGIVSYQKSFQTLSDYSKAANALVAENFLRELDMMFLNASRLLELESNPMVRRFLFSQTETYPEAMGILQTFKLYRETYQLNELVLNVTLVNLYGKGISERKGVFQLNQNLRKEPYFQTLLELPDETLYVPPSSVPSVPKLDGLDYGGKKTISIISTIKQPITHQVIGFITIDLDSSVVQEFSETNRIGRTGYFFVADKNGKPIFMPEPQAAGVGWLPPLTDVARFGGTRGQLVDNSLGIPVFVIYTISSQTGWYIVGQVPLAEITRDAVQIRNLIFASAILSVVVAITLYFYLTNRMTRPIQILKNKMRLAASGYLEAKAQIGGTDEIADLGRSFNTMLEQIKQLLDRSIEEQKQIQLAELRTLQAQINPHFLYNTLDSIVWMAEARKHDQVIRLVQALSQFFRISLSKGKDVISIGEEIDHIRNYLIIQQMRYRDILSYDIRVDPGILHCRVLKMTLQPLVENALYHGIKNKRRKGLIEVRGWRDGQGGILLKVSDNGIGMTPDRLDEIRRSLSGGIEPRSDSPDETRHQGFGLRNVHQRIRLYYGEPYGLHIESAYMEGTEVTLRIPDIEGEGHEEDSARG